MAAERSYLNCLRCSDLSRRLGACSQDDSPGAHLIRNQLEEYQHAARDRALQSLDEWYGSYYSGLYEREIAFEGGMICLDCDGSQHSLALYLKQELPGFFARKLENESEPKPATYRTNGSERSKK